MKYVVRNCLFDIDWYRQLRKMKNFFAFSEGFEQKITLFLEKVEYRSLVPKGVLHVVRRFYSFFSFLLPSYPQKILELLLIIMTLF